MAITVQKPMRNPPSYTSPCNQYYHPMGMMTTSAISMVNWNGMNHFTAITGILSHSAPARPRTTCPAHHVHSVAASTEPSSTLTGYIFHRS